MPGGFPAAGFVISNPQSIGAVTGSSNGTVITASASTNTKGSYTSLVTATLYESSFILLQVNNGAGTFLVLVDIAIGTSGNQVVIIPNIFGGAQAGTSAARSMITIALPIAIPAGTQIWARCQSATASATCTVSAVLYSGSFAMLKGAAGYDDLGTTLATTLGTSITPSATSETLGSWTNIITSTARDYMGLWGVIGTGTAAANYLMNIGIGTSGSQVIIIPNWSSIDSNTAGTNTGIVLPLLPIQIPKGTNIWAQNQAAGASKAAQSMILYGAYQ